MKLKEMEEMEKMARKVNTRVGSLLVSTAPCSLTCQENLVKPRAAGASCGFSSTDLTFFKCWRQTQVGDDTQKLPDHSRGRKYRLPSSDAESKGQGIPWPTPREPPSVSPGVGTCRGESSRSSRGCGSRVVLLCMQCPWSFDPHLLLGGVTLP